MTVDATPLVRHEVLRHDVAAAYRDTFAPDEQCRCPAFVPPGWEGLHFPFDVPLAGLRPDGSPATDRILPEIDIPHRMYAGEDTVFHRPLRYGDDAEQRNVIGHIEHKQGQSGPLTFVDIERTYLQDDEVAVTSVWHDVFVTATAAAGPAPAAAAPDGTGWDWEEPWRIDTRQLFRFSAITFNTHRIHYDQAWAREVEGLPDLVVQGPLVRILLLDAARRHRPALRLVRAAVRMRSPVYVETDVRLVGRTTSNGVEVAMLSQNDDRLATAHLDTITEE